MTDSGSEPGASEAPPLPADGEGRSPERRRDILRERAKQLAREPAAGESGERLEVVEFLLGSEHYGIETSFVREVHPFREVTPLPCTPFFVLGIMNLRGEILSVIDIGTFFDLQPQAHGESTKVIVLTCATMQFGVLADAVLGVRTILSGATQGSPAAVTGLRADYLKGVTREHLVLLDAGKMLADRRLVVHEEV